MDAQSIRNLQEAYLEIYQQLDEKQEELKQRNKNEMQRKAGNLGREVVSSKKGPKRTAAMDRMSKLVSSIARDDENKRFKTLGQSPAHNEEVDIYDVILSHLIDEGYASTEEAATAIMVNMSEEWKDSVVEAYKDLPVGKMIRKTGHKQFKSGMDVGSDIGKGKYNPETNSRSSKYSKQVGKMAAVASMHSPENAQAKSKLKKG